jgi:hypothetical protein
MEMVEFVFTFVGLLVGLLVMFVVFTRIFIPKECRQRTWTDTLRLVNILRQPGPWTAEKSRAASVIAVWVCIVVIPVAVRSVPKRPAPYPYGPGYGYGYGMAAGGGYVTPVTPYRGLSPAEQYTARASGASPYSSVDYRDKVANGTRHLGYGSTPGSGYVSPYVP